MKPLFISLIIGGVVYLVGKFRGRKPGVPPDPSEYPAVNPFSVAQLWGTDQRAEAMLRLAREICQKACNLEHGNTILQGLWIYRRSGLLIVQGTAYQKAKSMGEVRAALGFANLFPVWAVWGHFPHVPDAMLCNCEHGWVAG